MAASQTLWTQTARTTFTGSASLPKRVDVAIIGGGFTGLTAARELTLAGRSVAVLEGHYLGAGASGMNAGFVVPNFAKSDPVTTRARLGDAAGEALLRLVGDGATQVFRTIAEEGILCDARQTGWLNPAYGPAMAEALQQRAKMWQALGRPVRFLSPQEVCDQTGMTIYSGALLDEEGGTIHPLDYLIGLAHAVIKRGGVICEGQMVRKVIRAGTAWQLITAKGQTLVADQVLQCTNAYTTGIARDMGRSCVPLRVYQMATAPIDETVALRIAREGRPLGDTRQNLFTYRLDRDRRLISGGMAALPIGAFRRLGRAVATRLANELELPQLAPTQIVWTGTAAMTPDFLPRLYQRGEGWFGGIGCNGRGIAMTAQLGRVLAQAAMGAKVTSLPIPLRKLRPLPFHGLTPIVASAALVQARLKDRFAA